MTNREVIDCLRRMPDIDRPITFEVDGGNTHKLFAEHVNMDGSCEVTVSPRHHDTVATVRDILCTLFFWSPDGRLTFFASGAGAGVDGMYTAKGVRQTGADATIILEGGAA